MAGWAVKLRERVIRERRIGESRYRSASLTLDGNPTRVRNHFRIIAPAVWKLIPEGRKFSVFEDSAQLVEALREWEPLHLSGYGSAIGRLFRYLAESGESMPLPRAVTFSSDAMAPAERTIIENDFGIPVQGIYSATEAFSIGFECGEGEGYHINDDVTVVRIVDDDGPRLDVRQPIEHQALALQRARALAAHDHRDFVAGARQVRAQDSAERSRAEDCEFHLFP